MTKTKRSYQSPKVTRIRLDARQAVLAACTTVSGGKIFKANQCKTRRGCGGGHDNTATS